MIKIFSPTQAPHPIDLDSFNYPTFNPGINLYWYNKYYIISNDRDELTKFLDEYTGYFKADVKDGDKLFFDNSSFPSLLLGRINDTNPTSVKRVVKVDKADKIISDPQSINLLDNEGIIVEVSDSEWYYLSVAKSYKYKDNLFNKIKQNSVGNTFYCYAVENPRTVESYLGDTSKRVSTYKFIEYLNTKLPKLTEQEFESYKSMLQCANNEDYKLAMDAMIYSNVDNYKIKLVEALLYSPSLRNVNSRRLNSGMNTTTKYVYYMLNVKPSDLYEVAYGWRYYRSNGDRFVNFFKNYKENYPGIVNGEFSYEPVASIYEDRIKDDYWYREDLKTLGLKAHFVSKTDNCSLVPDTLNTAQHNLAISIIAKAEKEYKYFIEYFNLKLILV